MKCRILVLIILILTSCGNKSKIKEDLKILQSKGITLPTEVKILVNGKDTLIHNFLDSDLKLIVYTDSTECASCSLSKMYLWNDIIEKTDKYNGRLNPHLPKNPQLHSFLLDENNNVILVGNPLHNKKVQEMFYKMALRYFDSGKNPRSVTELRLLSECNESKHRDGN